MDITATLELFNC